VYGPGHYNSRGELSKKQLLKVKVLERLGYKVVGVPRHAMRDDVDVAIKMRTALAIATQN